MFLSVALGRVCTRYTVKTARGSRGVTQSGRNDNLGFYWKSVGDMLSWTVNTSYKKATNFVNASFMTAV